jgi:hypothetical protein
MSEPNAASNNCEINREYDTRFRGLHEENDENEIDAHEGRSPNGMLFDWFDRDSRCCSDGRLSGRDE